MIMTPETYFLSSFTVVSPKPPNGLGTMKFGILFPLGQSYSPDIFFLNQPG